MRKIVIAAVLAVTALLAAACASHSPGALSASSHPSAAAAASSAAAKAKALASSPEVQAKVKQVAPKLQSCAQANGFRLTITGAGTEQVSAQLAGVRGTTLMHLDRSLKAAFQCAGLTKADVDKVWVYFKGQVKANGIGQGSGTKDFTNTLNYAAGLMTGQAS